MTDRRNVVLVTVDSLRADHCGFMGHTRATTPTLDDMAADGVAFENAIAPGPSTYESMPAVFTGEPITSYPAKEGDSLDERTRNIELNTIHETIPEWFRDRGYATAAFTTNPYTGAHTNFARGFDRFEDFMGDGEGPIMRKAAHVPLLSELKHLVTLVRGDRASKTWTDYYEDVVSWANETEEPYFLWVFLLDAHTPYLAPARHRRGISRFEMYARNWQLWMSKKWGALDATALNREKLRRLYDSTVRSVDEFLGRLRADLAGDDPVFVVHADHGEAFGEHGTFGHDAALYEENIHVPLVVDGVETTGSVSCPFSLRRLDSLLRCVAAGQVEPTLSQYAIATTHPGDAIAVRGEEWKYIAELNPDGHIESEAVYDLNEDPDERRNIAATQPELTAACQRIVQRRQSHEREMHAISGGAIDLVASRYGGEDR